MNDGPIVAGWDGTERGRDALALAGLLARAHGTTVSVVHAFYLWPNDGPLPYEVTAGLREAAEAQMAPIPSELLDGVDCEVHVVGGPSPGHALHDFAESEDAQLVVLGSTHRGPLGRVLPGSTADRFLHGAPCPVAIAPTGYAKDAVHSLGFVAAAFDGTPESEAAVHEAAELALATGARLRLISVVEPQAYAAFGTGAMITADLTDTRRDYLRGELGRIRDELSPQLEVKVRLLTGVAAERVVGETASVDLLVVGSRGYGPVRRVLLGSVSGAVVRRSSCPVLVVPRAVVRSVEQAEIETAASA